jgi:hypothetical protein
MLRYKEGTGVAKMGVGRLVDFLVASLRRLVSPGFAGRGLFLFVLLSAAPAMAVQTHGPPEGYYVHQMAHFFFGGALVFLLYLLHARPVGVGRAWYYFRLSLFFFLLWNIWTFAAHWLADQLPAEALVTTGSLWEHRFNPQLSVTNVLYYITRFDHILCVPGIWFLLQSLKGFCLEITRKTEGEGERHG